MVHRVPADLAQHLTTDSRGVRGAGKVTDADEMMRARTGQTSWQCLLELPALQPQGLFPGLSQCQI